MALKTFLPETGYASVIAKAVLFETAVQRRLASFAVERDAFSGLSPLNDEQHAAVCNIVNFDITCVQVVSLFLGVVVGVM